MIIKIKYLKSTEQTRNLWEIITEHNGKRIDYNVERNAKSILKYLQRLKNSISGEVR